MALTLKQLIKIAWCTISVSPLFANKWLCDETAHRLLLARYPTFEAEGRITRALVAKALNELAEEREKNIYHAMFSTECPHETQEGKRRVHFYYQDTVGKAPKKPTEASECYDVYAKSTEMVERRIRVSRNKQNADEEEDVEEKLRRMVTEQLKKEASRILWTVSR